VVLLTLISTVASSWNVLFPELLKKLLSSVVEGVCDHGIVVLVAGNDCDDVPCHIQIIGAKRCTLCNEDARRTLNDTSLSTWNSILHRRLVANMSPLGV